MEATQNILAYALQGLNNVRYLLGKGVQAADFQEAYKDLWEQLVEQSKSAKASLDLQACVEALELRQHLGVTRLLNHLVLEGRGLPREAVDGAVARMNRQRLRDRLGADVRNVLSVVETAKEEDVLAVTGKVVAELTRIMGAAAADEGLGNQASLADFACQVHRDLAKRPVKSLPGVPSRFPTFNELTAGGYEPGHLIVVAGRTGIGKTLYALAEALHLAQWGRVLYFSLEMNGVELARRVLASLTGVHNRHIKTNDLEAAERTRLLQATSDARIKNIWIEDCSSASPAYVRSRIADHMGREGLPPVVAVILDHANIMSADGLRAAASPTEVVTQVAHASKGIAKEWNVPFILLAQLNREAEKRSKDEDQNEPQLSDLKQSGALEEDANLVVLLHRQRTNKKSLQVILAKARDGEVGRFTVLLNLAKNDMQELSGMEAAA